MNWREIQQEEIFYNGFFLIDLTGDLGNAKFVLTIVN